MPPPARRAAFVGTPATTGALTRTLRSPNRPRSMAHAPALAVADDLAPRFARERPADAHAVEGLIVRAFGPGRLAKTAERLREGREPLRALSFVAWSDGEAVGCVRQWPILIGETRALFLGPIAVEHNWRRHGLGGDLIRHARDAAVRAGEDLILLVGDRPFFGPLGFSADLTGRVRLPGPVDPARLLARELIAGAAAGLAGAVRSIAA